MRAAPPTWATGYPKWPDTWLQRMCELAGRPSGLPISIDGGYQYALATVTNEGSTTYLGNWIPEVARNLATANVRASRPAIGTSDLNRWRIPIRPCHRNQ